MATSPCPSMAQLEALLLGKTTTAEESELREHLLQCVACEELASSVPAVDRLVEHVRAGGRLGEPESPNLDHLLRSGSDWSVTSSDTPDSVLELEESTSASPDSSLSIQISTPSPDAPRVVITDPASDPTRIRPPGADADPSRERASDGAADDRHAPTEPTEPSNASDLGRVGPFRILSVLGQGGMGVVFLAEDTSLKRHVALKAMKAGEHSRAATARFLREARAAGRFHHPNLATVFAVGQEGETPYISMELLRGPDLENRVRIHGTLNPREAAEAIRHAARGLQHAHAKGVIHRDVKPSNLMYAEEGVVKVLDLGVARISRTSDEDSRNPSEATRKGMVVGTINYMAPEQAIDPTAVDERADVFSLGGVLHFLLTGKPPYQGSSRASLILEGVPPDPEPTPTDCPPALTAVMTKMTAVQPSKRYRNMSEVIAALDLVIDSPANVLDIVPSRTLGGRFAALAPIAGLFAAVLVMTATFVVWAGGDRPARDPESRSPSTASDAPLVAAPLKPRPDHAAMKAATWLEGPTAGVLPGAVVAPTVVPGYKTWQVVSASPDWDVYGVAFDPTGKRLAIACDARLRIYDRATLQVTDFAYAAAPIGSIAWSPDGRRIAAHLDTGAVVVWDENLVLVSTLGPAAARWPGLSHSQLQWTSDGRSVVYMETAAGVAHIDDVTDAEGASRVVLRAPNDKLLGATASPDGAFVATGSESGKLRIWKRDGSLVREFDAVVGSFAVAWSPDGEWIIAIKGYADPPVKLWKPDGTPGPAFDHPSVQGAVWRSDSQSLLTYGADSVAFDWSLDGKRLREFSAQMGCWRATYAPTGDDYCVAAAARFHVVPGKPSDSSNARFWRIGMGATDVAWSPDGSRLATGANHIGVAVWGEDGRIETSQIELLGSQLAWRRDGGALAYFGRWRPGVAVWDAVQNESSRWADLPGMHRTPVGWTPDGRLSVAASGALTNWLGWTDSSAPLSLHTNGVSFGGWSPDGSRLVAAGEDNVLRFYKTDGTVIASHAAAPGDAFRRAVWHRDGSRAAVIQRSTVQVFSADGALLRSFYVAEPELHTIDWSTDGRRLIGGAPWKFIVWNEDGTEVLRKPRECPRVYVASDPRRERVASLTHGGYLHMHNLAADRVEWCGVMTEWGAFTFSPAGELLAGDPALAEKEIVCVAERENGDMEAFTPSQWRSIVEAAQAVKTP